MSDHELRGRVERQLHTIAKAVDYLFRELVDMRWGTPHDELVELLRELEIEPESELSGDDLRAQRDREAALKPELSGPQQFLQDIAPLDKSARRFIEVWCEGYQTNGEVDRAKRLIAGEFDSFDDAVRAWVSSSAAHAPYVTKGNDETGHWRYWGCKLFNNEADARRAFG